MNGHSWKLLKHDLKYVYRCDECGAEVEAGKDENPDAVSRRFVTLQSCEDRRSGGPGRTLPREP